MNVLMFALLLNCPTPVIINETKIWNDIDQRTLKQAIKRCGELYQEAPCLDVLKKIEENTYAVMCGWKKAT